MRWNPSMKRPPSINTGQNRKLPIVKKGMELHNTWGLRVTAFKSQETAMRLRQ